MSKAAGQGIITEIRSATATMTSVPKPLKFLSPHVDALKARFEQLPVASESRLMLSDILSVLCTTIAVREGARDALTYRLKVNSSFLKLMLRIKSSTQDSTSHNTAQAKQHAREHVCSTTKSAAV